MLLEIRIHGRGGQGVVSASEILALAFFAEGKKVQAFPSFGVERSGAPVQSFVRVSDQEILNREQIYSPDVLIIQDDTLLNDLSILSGVKENTIIIINTNKSLEDTFERVKTFYKMPDWFSKDNVQVLDATQIALEIFQRNIVNTAILGSLARNPGFIKIESLLLAIEQKFSHKSQEIIDKNILAARKVYNL